VCVLCVYTHTYIYIYIYTGDFWSSAVHVMQGLNAFCNRSPSQYSALAGVVRVL
jgi:hypothetical protein